MKFKLIINHIIVGLLAILVITVLFKVNQSAIKNERKQEISSDGLEISSIKEMNITAAKWQLKHSKRLLVELAHLKWWQFKKKRDILSRQKILFLF